MLLGLDLGTGSVKALVLDEAGQIRRGVSRPYAVKARHRGWAESAPMDWWQATQAAVHEAVAGATITALSFSGQMHGVVLLDEQQTPLCDAVLWADTRSTRVLERYHQLTPAQKQRLANPVVAGMAGPTLLWFQRYAPEVYTQVRWALQPKDWLRYQLTHTINSEPSDASATLLYDLEKGSWAGEIMAVLGLNQQILPPLVASHEVVGELTSQAAEALGLPVGLPVVAGAGDAAASVLGSGLLAEGDVQANIGTAMQIMAVRKTPQRDSTLRTHLYCTASGTHYAMAAMQNAGTALEHARQLLKLTWEEMYDAAFSLSDSAGVIFHPYVTGERTPHLNPQARASWLGIGLDHTHAHLARSAFEGVAFALADGLAALRDVGVQFDTLRFAGGGSQDSRWQQLVADTLQVPLGITSAPSASARGAALLAGVGTGVFEGFEATLPSRPLVRHYIEPKKDKALHEHYAQFKAYYQALYPA